MRVLIAGAETCGIIRDLAAEFKRRGDHVVTLAVRNPFFDYKYDLNDTPGMLPLSWGRSWMSPLVAKGVVKALWTINGLGRYEEFIRRRLVSQCDFYLQISGGIRHQRLMLTEAKRGGVPSAVLLMGSDVRDYRVFQRQYDVGDWECPESLYAKPDEKLNILREVESYASAVFSVPDQMGLAERPYYHLQIPLDLNRYTPEIPGREIPHILHAPSKSSLKGTATIESVLEKLKSNGFQFEYLRLEGVANSEILKALTKADVLVDQLILHGPGWLGMEAMASGCAVATRHLADSPPCFRPPLVPIDHRTIYEQLSTLISDREQRIRLAKEGLEYTKGHAISTVVDRIVGLATKSCSTAEDYVPVRTTVRNGDDLRTVHAGNSADKSDYVGANDSCSERS